MQYVIYCDESRHNNVADHPFMAIGGLWVPRDHKHDLTREFRLLCRSQNLGAEIKWRKVSRMHLEAYKKLIDFFADQQELRFRVIVVEQAKLDLAKYHGSDRELGFYKFYYEMLVKWIEGVGDQYLILLDYKQNKGADRYTTLRKFLERKITGKAWITDLTVIDSAMAPLCQLCDLLTGATAASWSGFKSNSPKAELAAYIAERCHLPTLKSEDTSPAINKFNIFRIKLN